MPWFVTKMFPFISISQWYHISGCVFNKIMLKSYMTYLKNFFCQPSISCIKYSSFIGSFWQLQHFFTILTPIKRYNMKLFSFSKQMKSTLINLLSTIHINPCFVLKKSVLLNYNQEAHNIDRQRTKKTSWLHSQGSIHLQYRYRLS